LDIYVTCFLFNKEKYVVVRTFVHNALSFLVFNTPLFSDELEYIYIYISFFRNVMFVQLKQPIQTREIF